MDCSPPGPSVHGILQARILEWVAISISRGSCPPRDWTCVSCLGRWIFSPLSHLGSLVPWLPTCCLASAPTPTLLEILFHLHLMRIPCFPRAQREYDEKHQTKSQGQGFVSKVVYQCDLDNASFSSLWFTFLLISNERIGQGGSHTLLAIWNCLPQP